jgi:putative acetyltransferase
MHAFSANAKNCMLTMCKTLETIALESPDQPEVIALIAELDAYQDTLYPPESRYSLDLASLKQPNVLFAVARDGAGHAIGSGCRLLTLETGPYQHEALALYDSAGYERRGPFGDYADDPLSVFMQKHIAA